MNGGPHCAGTSCVLTFNQMSMCLSAHSQQLAVAADSGSPRAKGSTAARQRWGSGWGLGEQRGWELGKGLEFSGDWGTTKGRGCWGNREIVMKLGFMGPLGYGTERKCSAAYENENCEVPYLGFKTWPLWALIPALPSPIWALVFFF